MKREIQQPTTDERGDEVHPAYGLIGAHRVTCNPGAVLFDSEITHNDIVRVQLHTATRKRDLHHNWIHEDKTLFEVDMSEAQWASFVSSMNVGSGVPCTITRTETEWDTPGLPFKPALGESLAEVRAAAHKTFDKIRAARDAYEAAIARKAPASEIKSLRSTLHYAIEHATANLEFAAKSLNEHAENVVQKARADVEAMVLRAQQQTDHAIEAAPTVRRPIGRTPTTRVIDALPAGESDQ